MARGPGTQLKLGVNERDDDDDDCQAVGTDDLARGVDGEGKGGDERRGSRKDLIGLSGGPGPPQGLP
jgi:hypothetical protein